MRAARLALATLGIVVLVWFLLGLRQAHDVSVASNIVSQSAPVTPSEAARASSLLRSASTLNPDREVDVLRAALATDTRQFRRARQIAKTVVTAEPFNIEAWYTLAIVAGSDSKLEARALIQISKLDPHAAHSG